MNEKCNYTRVCIDGFEIGRGRSEKNKNLYLAGREYNLEHGTNTKSE
jgi:hypothetical protein